jgi:hypothetical protein
MHGWRHPADATLTKRTCRSTILMGTAAIGRPVTGAIAAHTPRGRYRWAGFNNTAFGEDISSRCIIALPFLITYHSLKR